MNTKKTYSSPELVKLGSINEMTKLIDKEYMAPGDGYAFAGRAIGTVS